MELDEHLFRRESGRIVATLVRIFGMRVWPWQKTLLRTPSAGRWKFGSFAACQITPRPG